MAIQALQEKGIESIDYIGDTDTNDVRQITKSVPLKHIALRTILTIALSIPKD